MTSAPFGRRVCSRLFAVLLRVALLALGGMANAQQAPAEQVAARMESCRFSRRLVILIACLVSVVTACSDLGRLGAAECLGSFRSDTARVVFFGDSITEAWPSAMPEFFAHQPYIARGKSGETTRQMLERFDRDVLDLAPQVVVILAGTNDIAEATGAYDEDETRGNLRTMTERARARGIGVVLASLLPARNYPWRHDGVDPTPKIVALNAWIEDFASRAGAVYLDYHSAMVDQEHGLRVELGKDAVHPNPIGYRVMAPLADAAIRTALANAGRAALRTTNPDCSSR